MPFSYSNANAPNLGNWFNPGLTPPANAPRMAGQDLAPYPILNARNASVPAPSGDTVNMFIDSIDGDAGYAASIMGVCEDRTTFALRCTSAPALADHEAVCGPNGPIMTVTAGDTHYEVKEVTATRTLGYDVTVSAIETCTLAGTTAATCTATAGGEADGTTTAATTVVTITSPTYYRFDVAITGGAEKTKNPSPTCSRENSAPSLNPKSMAIWALTGTFGVASLLAML